MNDTTLDPVAFLAALDEAPALPCGGTVNGGEPCPRPAAWGARCAQCGHDMQSCTPHREQADHLVAEHDGIAVCGSRYGGTVCERQYPTPIPWRPL